MEKNAGEQRPPASLELDRLGIPHSVFRHAGAITSLEQAARERGQRPEQVVRSILFRLGQGDYVLVLAPGGTQIPWKKLRKHLGQNRLALATSDEVLLVTGYVVGAVSPFGMRQRLPILIDRRISGEEQISIGSGVANTGIVMRSQDLLDALVGTELLDLE